ncbi:hypothetical protein [Nocardioides sp.]|uniref:hypothetical protein n=1 Tax=Nocardioides sp. TaxID=35761 RepID=UPI0027358ACE|nr:hypothetical protein [Nocardioides sp.]MDP3891918.1 hypothetical protein [Nocardioides sp.]
MPSASPPPTRASALGPWLGVAAVGALVFAAAVIPDATGWDVASRRDGRGWEPLHGYVEVKVGPGTLPAALLALLGAGYAGRLARALPWRPLLLVSFVAGLLWLLSLALVDGTDGLTRVLGNPYEYLETARAVTSVGTTLDEFVDRIPYAHDDNWVTHVAGHPPGALLFFVGLVRVGLGGDLAASLVVTVLAATIPPAVLVTMRTLGAETAARRAAPFLVLGPAAVFMAVSADAVFTAVAAWGLAALAVAATRPARGPAVAWSVLAGLLLGSCVLLSYGLPLLGFLAVAVLMAARSWLPLPVAAATALALVLGFAAGGFAWWEALPVLRERYWDGIASERPAAYWLWGNLAALALSAGPVLGAGLACARRSTDRVVLLIVAGAAAAVLVADLSQMSKAEVERIWLPFVPWLLVVTAALPERWQRAGLTLQLATALALQHFLYTSW